MTRIPQYIKNIIKSYCDKNGNSKLEKNVQVNGNTYNEIGLFNEAIASYNEKTQTFSLEGQKYDINSILEKSIKKKELIEKSDKTRVEKLTVNKKIPYKIKTETVKKEEFSIGGEKAFENDTLKLINERIPHKTKLLDIAQDSLGLIEVTGDEYEKLSENKKAYTQMKIVSKYGGSADDAWCAYTVSYLSEKAGMNIGGAKSSVYKNNKSSFVTWAKKNNTWHSIKTNKMTENNYIEERESRISALKEQLSKMHEGDFIVWASQYAVPTDKGIQTAQASHIGIIESVNTNKGTVTVIEGNANINTQGENSERVPVDSVDGDSRGNQQYGEFKEVNRRDGLIRKVYTIEDLAKHGYSGFIDNSKIVK